MQTYSKKLIFDKHILIATLQQLLLIMIRLRLMVHQPEFRYAPKLIQYFAFTVHIYFTLGTKFLVFIYRSTSIHRNIAQERHFYYHKEMRNTSKEFVKSATKAEMFANNRERRHTPNN